MIKLKFVQESLINVSELPWKTNGKYGVSFKNQYIIIIMYLYAKLENNFNSKLFS